MKNKSGKLTPVKLALYRDPHFLDNYDYSSEIPDALLHALASVSLVDAQRALHRDRYGNTLDWKDQTLMAFLAAGLTVSSIADLMNYSKSTLDGRLKKIRRILDAHNTTHAVAIAIRKGII